MGGIPISTGCEACRKQKKKCQGARAPCIRCRRLNIKCESFGQQRYLFKASGSKDVCNLVRIQARLSTPRAPIISGSTTINKFVTLLETDKHHCFSLVWHFGPYLQEMPRRMSCNNTLNQACEALANVYQFRRLNTGVLVSQSCLNSYGRALATFRNSLHSHDSLITVETLCVVLVLAAIETLLGVSDTSLHHHCSGVASLLHRYTLQDNVHERSDELAPLVLPSVRGIIITQSSFLKDDPCSTMDREALLLPHSTTHTEHDVCWRCVVQGQDLLRSTRAYFGGVERIESQRSTLLHEAVSLWTQLEPARMKFLVNLDQCEQEYRLTHTAFRSPPTEKGELHAQVALSAAICIATSILFERLIVLLRTVEREEHAPVAIQSYRAQEMLDLVNNAQHLRPFGTMSLLMPVRMAILGATDSDQRQHLCNRLQELAEDFADATRDTRLKELDDRAKWVFLADIFPVEY